MRLSCILLHHILPRPLLEHLWYLFSNMDSLLKFRVWDPLLCQFSYFTLRDNLPSSLHDTPDQQIQQCIGLVDTNGKDIYQGDIVFFDNSDWDTQVVRGLAEVVFCRDLLLVEAPQYGLWFKNGFHASLRGKTEIRGNIFEDPELTTHAEEQLPGSGGGL